MRNEKYSTADAPPPAPLRLENPWIGKVRAAGEELLQCCRQMALEALIYEDILFAQCLPGQLIYIN